MRIEGRTRMQRMRRAMHSRPVEIGDSEEMEIGESDDRSQWRTDPCASGVPGIDRVS